MATIILRKIVGVIKFLKPHTNSRTIAMAHPKQIVKPIIKSKRWNNLEEYKKEIPKFVPTVKQEVNNIVNPIYQYPKKINYFANENLKKSNSNMTENKIPQKSSISAKEKPTFEDYYKTLGVKDNSTIDDIKRAYYILAKKYHPDCLGYSTKSAEEFQKIAKAYNILSDSTKKGRYDQLRLKAPCENIKILPSTSFHFKDQTRKLIQLLDKNKNTIANISAKTYNTTAAKYRHGIIDVAITFLESVQGTTKDIYLKSFSNCPKCNQIDQRKTLKICEKCNGLGTYTVQTKTYKCNKQCDLCYGRCYITQCKCLHCDNRGFLLKDNRIKVNIKSGVQNNDILKVTHQIDDKKAVNNLQVKVRVLESEHFKRIDNDIHTEKKISITDAILGGNFKTRGIYDVVNLELKPGTELNSVIKLPGKGVRTNSGIGDHYVKLIIEMPKYLTKEQRSLYMELSKIEKSNVLNKVVNGQ